MASKTKGKFSTDSNRKFVGGDDKIFQMKKSSILNFNLEQYNMNKYNELWNIVRLTMFNFSLETIIR